MILDIKIIIMMMKIIIITICFCCLATLPRSTSYKVLLKPTKH